MPAAGESQKEFVSRCIPIVLNDGTAKDPEQAAAVCYSLWEKKSVSEHTLTIKLETPEVKAGARHSASDQMHLNQAMHHIMQAGGMLPDQDNVEPGSTEEAGEPTPDGDEGSEWNASDILSDKALVFLGTEAKALGNGLVGGYLVRYGDEKKTDLTGDFFTAQTDTGPASESLAYYHHGLDKTLGKAPLKNKATIGKDDIGVWIKHQLDLRSEYEKAIYGLAEQKKLGWSSGTAGHLVERQKVGGAMWIKRWPLGLDASYTPTPAEPRNEALTLKAYVESLQPAEQPALKSAQVKPTADYYSKLFNRS